MKILYGLLTILMLSLLFCLFDTGIALAVGVVSPPLYVKGGPAGGFVTCRIFQYRSFSGETLGNKSIYSNISTTPLPLAFDSCKSSGVKQNENCSFSAKITGNFSYTCVFGSGGGSGAGYTGEIEIQDSQFNVIARAAMIPLN